MTPLCLSRRRLLRVAALAAGASAASMLAACGSATARTPIPPSARAAATAALPTTAAVGASATTGSPAAGAPPVAAAGKAQFTFKLSSSLAQGDNELWVFASKFAELVGQKTGGKIRIENFPNNQLGEEAQVIQQVKLGTVDIFTGGLAIWASLVPEVAVMDMGYLIDDIDHLGRVLDGAAGQQLAKLVLDKAQAQIVGWGYSYGFRNVLSRNPVKTPDNLHGLKIRVLPNPNYVATLKLMGASPSPIAFGEIYTSLQTGVIDALEHNAPTILTSKFYEVAKNLTLTQHIIGPVVAVIGKQKLDQLPQDLRTPFLSAATEAMTYQRGREPVIETDAFKSLEGFGVTTYPIDRAALRKKVEPLWTEFTQKYPPTKPILDAIEQARK